MRIALYICGVLGVIILIALLANDQKRFPCSPDYLENCPPAMNENY